MLYQRRYRHDEEAQERIFNITSHQEMQIKTSEISLHNYQSDYNLKK